MKKIKGKYKVDPCPDANGHWTIRPDDGSEHGDTSAQPIATVYDEKMADKIAALLCFADMIR